MLRVIRTSSLLHYIVALTSLAAAMLLWPGLLQNFFAVGNGTDEFMTHAHCYLGIPSLVRMHFYSDLLIGLSYVAISLTLTYLVYRARRDIPFHWVFLAFGLFIIACGSTHFMEVWTTYREPYYWLAGYLKLITAVASVATALVLPPLIPRTLRLVQAAKLSDARREELEAAHRELGVLYRKLRERDEPKTAFVAPVDENEDQPFAPILHEMQATLAELRETNQTLEAIIHASPLGIVALDPDGIVRIWNSSSERIYGWSEHEVLGRALPTVPPDKLEEVRSNHRRAVAGTEFKAFETVRLRKDGTLVNVCISTAPWRDAEGHVKGVVALVEDIRERKRAEREKAQLAAEVEMQRRRLDAIIASVPGVVWEAWGEPDAETQRIDFVSDYVETLLGYTVEEWLATPNFWLNIVHEEDKESAARTAAATFASGKVGTNQFRWVAKDGRVVWVEAQSVAIKDEAGRPVGMRGVTMDITERKEAGEGLRRWEQIFHHAGWGVAMSDPAEGILRSVNPAFAHMHGFTVEEMVGTPIAETFAPEERATLHEHIRLIQEKGHHVFESMHIRKDGTRFPVLADVTAFKDERGQVRYRAANVQDITERRQAEEAARFLADATTMLASSLDYELTLESVARLAVPYVADYCLVHMLEGEGTEIRRMIVAHQEPAREAAWREMQRRFPLDLNTPHTIAKVLRTGQPEIFPEVSDDMWQAVIRDPEEIRMLREFDIRAAMIMPLAARGRTIGALTFISSESARRYTDDDLAVARELARRAALAIDNARLYRRAQEANRAKDEFLATLSHELRTPLTPIIGWVHILSGVKPAEADITHGLAVIGKNSQSLSHLINDLLDMSAILSGKMRIDRLPVPLRAAVSEAIETVRPHAAGRNIRLELAPPPPPAAGAGDEDIFISGDRTRLVQVFWNLLTNAVKFSPGGSRVRIVCEVAGDAAAAAARVHVEDEGQGIQADFLPYVFDRFRQQDMSTTKAHGGLGIGLALVKSFVEAHGGTVAVASTGEERGSRFTVTLPLLARQQAEEEKAEAEAMTASDAAGSAAAEAACGIESACHALLIEDAPDTLEMLRVSFAVRGFRTTACATPEEALGIAADGHFDIIISDIGLPNIDGYELLKRLRSAMPYLRDVPALALTGYAAHKDVDAALAAGFDAHLAKPFDPATLAATVDALLNRRQSGTPDDGIPDRDAS